MINIISKLKNLCEKYKIEILYLFGSQSDKGVSFIKGAKIYIEETSDLDIGIIFKTLPVDRYEIYGALYLDLSILFEPFNIDLVFLQETEILFQYEAIKGYLIYCNNENFCDKYEEMVMKKASDISYKKISFEKDFMEAIKDGYITIAD
jgi:predicted nucleotidyltransferase